MRTITGENGVHLQLQYYLICAARSFCVRIPGSILTENTRQCSINNYNCGNNEVITAQNQLFLIAGCGYIFKCAFFYFR